MGHPPVSPSAPAPAGTTAIPGLIPDLVAGTPWPRWALIAGALAAGVLLVSCLLCAACCCCRRHRKKPRDKESVGLGSARGTTTTHLVQPDVDGLESSPGDAQQWGRLQLSLEFDFGSQEVKGPAAQDQRFCEFPERVTGEGQTPCPGWWGADRAGALG
nr:unnamed protein product [Homo sapiens]